ncbi:MAG TPA: hypothetical protein V6D26_17560 [Stenomitos sp.]
MKLQSQRLQAIIIPFIISVSPTQNDPLINRSGEKFVDIGVSLIAVTLVFVVWKLSPRVEHAMIFAIVLSITLIAFFWIR